MTPAAKRFLRRFAWALVIAFLVFFVGRTLPDHILQRDIWWGREYKGLEGLVPQVETIYAALGLVAAAMLAWFAKPVGRQFWHTWFVGLLAGGLMFLSTVQDRREARVVSPLPGLASCAAATPRRRRQLRSGECRRLGKSDRKYKLQNHYERIVLDPLEACPLGRVDQFNPLRQ